MSSQGKMQEEIDQYKDEKESVRKLLGQIGSTGTAGKEKMVNITFATLVILFFSFDVMRHALHVDIHFIPEMSALK
ncbi:MAG: hypothetical protein U9P42_08180 [Candidatus Fermentibacteria bacterium]|nr:hypothetical protein [Candidatus Fermentibacteria bacterium]